MRLYVKTCVVVLCLSLVVVGSAYADEMKHEEDVDMQLHHFHMMMNHGLEMVLEGSSQVMIAQMKMAPTLDAAMTSHGQEMMKNGEDMILHVLDGPEMMNLHKQGHADMSHMQHTHSLGEAMLAVVEILSSMSSVDMAMGDDMTMHHMHMTLNHALEMAVEGSNLIMLGQMGMAKAVDDFSMNHGKMMMSNAENLWKEVMEGEAMQAMHERGLSEDTPDMAMTHKLAEAVITVKDLLLDMPAHE